MQGGMPRGALRGHCGVHIDARLRRTGTRDTCRPAALRACVTPSRLRCARCAARGGNGARAVRAYRVL